MKIYKLNGNKSCSVCESQAEFYCDGLDFCLCKKCAVEFYRALGEHLVPRAIPNVILRSEERRQKGEIYLGIYQKDVTSGDLNEALAKNYDCREIEDGDVENLPKNNQNTGKASRNERRDKWQILKKKSLPKFRKNSKD